MKKMILTLAAVAALTLSAFAGGGSATVTTTATKILGAPSVKAGQDWAASTAYVQGEMVKSGSTYYFALVAGTTGSTAPTGAGDVTDGTVTWRYCMSGKRQGLFLANTGSTADVTFWWATPTAGAGIVLASGEKVVFSGGDAPQTPVYAIVGSGSETVVAMEW